MKVYTQLPGISTLFACNKPVLSPDYLPGIELAVFTAMANTPSDKRR